MLKTMVFLCKERHHFFVLTDEVSTVFSYNGAGDLTRIYNTRDQLITLDYDSHRAHRKMLAVYVYQGMR